MNTPRWATWTSEAPDAQARKLSRISSRISRSAEAESAPTVSKSTLDELAVAAALRVLATPDLADLVALEGQGQLAGVRGHEAGERHGQVEAQRHPPSAVVGEPVDLLVGLVAALAEQDLRVLERRRVDRAEAVGAVDGPRRVHRLARQHDVGQVVAEALQHPRFDAGHGGDSNMKAPGVSKAARAAAGPGAPPVCGLRRPRRPLRRPRSR